jgi:hypothetical protein
MEDLNKKYGEKRAKEIHDSIQKVLIGKSKDNLVVFDEYPSFILDKETIDKRRFDANRLGNMKSQQLDNSISNDMKVHCEEFLEDISKENK